METFLRDSIIKRDDNNNWMRESLWIKVFIVINQIKQIHVNIIFTYVNKNNSRVIIGNTII